MKPSIVFLTALLLKSTVALHAEDGGISWIVDYDGKFLPASPWTSIGQANATLGHGLTELLIEHRGVHLGLRIIEQAILWRGFAHAL